jgi:hypothetical protein
MRPQLSQMLFHDSSYFISEAATVQLVVIIFHVFISGASKMSIIYLHQGMFLSMQKQCCVVLSTVSKVKQSRYTPWRRLGGEEV